jgi:hypothetical protein
MSFKNTSINVWRDVLNIHMFSDTKFLALILILRAWDVFIFADREKPLIKYGTRRLIGFITLQLQMHS